MPAYDPRDIYGHLTVPPYTQRCARCGQDWWDSHVCPALTAAAPLVPTPSHTVQVGLPAAPALTEADELIHIVTWRYPDGSAFGVVSAHRTKAGAERMVELLKTHAETKRFDIESAPAEA